MGRVAGCGGVGRAIERAGRYLFSGAGILSWYRAMEHQVNRRFDTR
jgi:hypothetical protein